MNNFTLNLPTKIFFGKDVENNIGKIIKQRGYKKVLFHFGGESIKKYKLYDKVINSLYKSEIEFVELGGVKPNPRLNLVYEGIKIAKKENVDLILAVGGGSVIDSSKAIALGVYYDGDVWDLFNKESSKVIKKPTLAVDVASILTIPAAGSEMSPASVITNEENSRKFGFSSDLILPKFSILDPKLCMTLPKNQAANGISDMLAHVMERYFTNTKNVDTTDRMCEAMMRSIIINGQKLINDYDNYNNWAEILLCSTIAHNGILGVGRDESWISHSIEHELSAFYDIPHGQGLSIIFPAFIKNNYKTNISRYAQFASRVFDVSLPLENQEDIVIEGVKRLENFYTTIGLPIKLHEININEENFEIMARNIAIINKASYEDALNIYKLSL